MFRWLGWVFTVASLLLVAGGGYYLLYPDGTWISRENEALTVQEATQDLGLVTVGAEREIVFRFVNNAGNPRAVVGAKGI